MFFRKNKDNSPKQRFSLRSLLSPRKKSAVSDEELSELAVASIEDIDLSDLGYDRPGLDDGEPRAADIKDPEPQTTVVVVAPRSDDESGTAADAVTEIIVEAEEVHLVDEEERKPVPVKAQSDDGGKADGDAPTGEDIPLLAAYRADGRNETNHRFGSYLLKKGLISKDALHAASLEQAVTNEKMGKILVTTGFLADKDRIEAVLHIEHSRIAQEKVARCLIPVDILEQYSILVAAEQDEIIYVATCEPQRVVARVVAEYYPSKRIEFVSYHAGAMNSFLASMRKMSSIDDPANSEELMLDRIIYNALSLGASDIHIIPRATSYSILYRQDGVRNLIHTGNLTEYQVLIAKIKDKAAMDLAERRKPQDGGFQIEYASRMIDLRIATIPVADGAENCIIRLLDSDRVQPSLEKLGVSEVTKWRKGFRNQFGLCLICGPTGSGKTTTLNASVKEMDRFAKAIYTIEDPVEYRIPYVAQVAVNNQVGLDFASAIRAFMRADPDTIIVGEVRDKETAANALKAADTGHLVIATLHTGSIVGAVTRLKELGIAPRDLKYLLRSVMVQTLVRTTCKTCGGSGETSQGVACHNCGGSGYKGRTVVSECEYFETPEDVQRVIPEDDKIIHETWTTKEQDAVNKMYAGLTDMRELDRVFGPSIERFLRKEDRS
jgi:type II secretory ATPase GspE/PulE/Tfp pilus assembly ATPase PilB-like protein